MQDDVVEVVETEQSVPADGRVLRVDRLQRASAEVAREDDVDDVLGREALHGRDRVDDRDRALNRHLLADSELLPELSVQRIDQALARVHAPARQQPVLLAGLLVAAEQHPVVPAQQRRDADPGLSPHDPRTDGRSARAGGPEPANAPLAMGQLLGLDELDLAQALEQELDQLAEGAVSSRASDSRQGANRGSWRRHRCARAKTPAGWSARSWIGAPSA